MNKVIYLLALILFATSCKDDSYNLEKIAESNVEINNTQFAATAVNQQISTEAQQVLDYLETVVASNKILSGQQLEGPRSSLYSPDSEYKRLHDIVGKYPAVLGQDWFGAKDGSTSSAANALRNAKVQMAIEHWNNGGIVSFTWHHQYPGHINEGWSLVRKYANQDEFDQIVTEGTVMYDVWLSEVDLIAGYLKQLENEGVPVIFRPYHEMQGSWFWWGGKSYPSYIKLWNNLYERLVNYHNLNNLIWCWSPNKLVVAGYYPGDDKVDLTGVDIYASDRSDNAYINDHKRLRNITLKPRALAENGFLPTNAILNATSYAWFMTWHTQWFDNTYFGIPSSNGPGNTPTELLDVYSNPNVITLDEVEVGESIATSIMEEAEDLPVFDSAHPSVNANASMSGGYYSFIGTCVIDDFIEYTVNVPSGGVFPIELGVSEGPVRAIWQMSIDGTDQGGIFDAYDPNFKVTVKEMDSKSFTAGAHTFRFTVVGKNSLATKWNIGFDYIKLGSNKFEAEQLEIFDSAFPSTRSNADMSNGTYSFVGTCVLNDFIEYTIDVPNTANYNIKVGSSDGQVRAIWQCSIDGINVGDSYDAYSSSFGVTEVNVGNKTLSSGTHKLRFSVVGKNPAANSWNIGFDYFKLTPE